jgi:hypothetical protein
MARLTAAQRHRLKPSQFAVPELEAYPIEDPHHIALAKGRLKQFGYRLTKAEEARAWKRIAAAERKMLPRGHARSTPAALAKLPAHTIVELSRKKLIRFL